jgi:PAS domain-containing protein
VLEEVPLTARGGESRARVSVPGREGAEPRWYEICRRPGPDGSTLGFAVEADDLVAAEASLRRFVETLTETFAHLPIGLAVFDKNRRLGLFNPALTDLVRIDAVWLAGRPSLRDFLERLRETRQMPEQKDFAAWRRKLTELEEGAREGTYEENWVLPSGKVFRVSGRPHPQGALAFLFEDISTTIRLERRYRSELELSQATLDRLSEAVAVFDAAGALVFVNAAFETLWGLDPMAGLEGPGVAEMTALLAERCLPSPAWATLAEYATAAETRGAWSAEVATREGRALQLAVAPLPDASTLVVFRAEAAPARDPLLGELAFEQLALPAEAALRQIVATIAAAQTPAAFQALSASVQGLKDGLARSRELAGLGSEPGGPLAGLKAALAGRGLSLAVAGEGAGLGDAEMRRVATAVGLAAAALAAPGATITLVPGDGARRGVRVEAPAGPRAGAGEDVAFALARRVAEAAGGTLTLDVTGGMLGLEAVLPGPVPRALPPAIRALP